STPFFIAALSGPILGEWVRWRRWTAIAVGFAGVLVVTRPGTGSFQPAALLSLTGAVCYAFYAITTRILARTDSNATTLFYSNIVGALALIPALPFVWSTPTEPLIIALMVAMGAAGSFGHYLLIAAHRLPRPSRRALPLHLHRDRARDHVRISGVRGCAQPLDPCRRSHCDRLGTLYSA